MISKRMQTILLTMAEKKGIFSSEDLASLTNVSSRTIKNDIQALNSFLKDYGIKIVTQISKGYELFVEDRAKFDELLIHLRLHHSSITSSVPQYRYERVSYIIKKLLSVDYYIRLKYLEDELFVSHTTITQDLAEVREKLSEYDLALRVRPNYGIIIEGNEINKRLCISEYFFHNDVHTGFFAADHAMFVSNSNQKEISYINTLVVRIISKHNLVLYDYAEQNLVIHILVAIRRWRFYNYVHVSEEKADELMAAMEFPAADELRCELENYLNIILPVDESLYFVLHLQNKRINEVDEVSPDYTERIERTLYEIYLMLQQKYHYHVCDKRKYEQYFRLHIPVMVQRLHSGMIVRNQQTYDIINKYPLAVHVSMDINNILERNFDIKMDIGEFAYTVLYTNLLLESSSDSTPRILLACCQGRPEMITILSELDEYAPKLLNHIDFCTLYKLQQKDIHSYDVILTTVPIMQDFGIPTSCIAGKTSYVEQIRKAISSLRAREINLGSLFYSEYILYDVKAVDRDYTIKKIAGQFGTLYEDVYTSLWESERIMSGETENNIAYLHTANPFPKDFILIATLKKPIIWHKQWVQYIVWINLENQNMVKLSACYDMLSEKFAETVSSGEQKRTESVEALTRWLIGEV